MSKNITPSASAVGALKHYSSAPVLNDGDAVELQSDSAGNLLVNVVAGGGSGSNAAASQAGASVPADADYQGVNIGGNLVGVTGLAVGSVKAPTVAIVDASGNQVTAFGGSSAAITTNKHLVSAGSDNATSVKGSAATLFAVRVFNNAAYPVYIKLYNKASSPTVGTDTVFKTIGVQAGTQRDVEITGGGLTMGTGLALGIVKGIADTDDAAVVASDCVVDIEYS